MKGCCIVVIEQYLHRLVYVRLLANFVSGWSSCWTARL